MKSSKVTSYAIIAAIVFVGIVLDTVFKTIFAFQPAIVTMLCITTICLLTGRNQSLFACGVFGVLSMVRAIIMPGGAAALTFISFWTSFANPFISVLPRVLIAVVVRLVASTMVKFVRGETLVYGVSSLLGVFSNTVMCAVMMIVFKLLTNLETDIFATVIIPFFSINCVIEAVVCGFVTPMLVKGLKGKVVLED